MPPSTTLVGSGGKPVMPLSVEKELVHAAAMKCEGQCAYSLQDASWYVQGAEGSRVDCGLLNIQPPLKFENATQRILTLRDHVGEGKKNCIPLDIKSMVPVLCHKDRGGVFHHAIVMPEQQQQNVAAFIVFSPMNPGLVAVFPRHYANGLQPTVRYGKTYLYWRNLPLAFQPAPSFGLELMPFVMPIRFLRQALCCLLEYVDGRAEAWINPFNNIKFATCPRPDQHSIDLLYPSEGHKNQDLKTLKLLWSALRTYSSEYTLARLTIQPSVGDFMVHHTASGFESMFEVKSRMSRILKDRKTFMHRKWMTDAKGSKWIFLPTSMWDFLLARTEKGDLVVLGRDDLPEIWFRPEAAPDAQEWHVWRPQDFDIMSRVIPVDSSPRVIADRFGQIFNDYRARRAWRAKRQLPLVQMDFAAADVDDDDDAEVDESRSQKPNVIARGEGRIWSPYMWQAEMEEWLARECQSSGRGFFLRVGNNPSGTFVFVAGRHRGGEDAKIRFEDLPLLTPMLYVNFALVDVVDVRLANDARHHTLYYRATHGPHNSFYVLLPSPHTNTWSSVNRFVVPSTAINTPQRRDYNEQRIAGGGRPAMGGTRLMLLEDQMIDVYAQKPGQVVPELCRILENPGATTPVFMGDLETGVGTHVRPADFIVDKRIVLQDLMDVVDKLTFLNRLKSNPLADDNEAGAE